jgi:hypothetical protein
VRTTVKQTAAKGPAAPAAKDEAPAGQYVNNVNVRVIGSQNSDFVSGETDLRGVFVADGIHGKSTVIARAEGSRYAFFRGQTELAPGRYRAAEAGAPAEAAKLAPQTGKPAAQPAAPQSLEKQLLEGLQEQNKSFQGKQIEQLDKMYKEQPRKGVEVKAAF